jgi:hypothetical protein
MCLEEILKHRHWQADSRIITILTAVKIFNPATSTWIDGISYQCTNGINTREVYCRDTVDFYKTFKPHTLLDEEQIGWIWP